MKKLLYIILVIEVLATAFNFFVNLDVSANFAFINLVLNILSIVPIIAIIANIDSIERLREKLNCVRYNIKALADEKNPPKKAEQSAPPIRKNIQTARGTWECLKCGTINKEGTSSCSNCKADYSVWDNPTDSPSNKKILSCWVK